MQFRDTPQLSSKELQRLLKRLKPDDPVRPAAEALAHGDFDEFEVTDELIQVLADHRPRNWDRRMIAAEALRFSSLPPLQASAVENLGVSILQATETSLSEKLIAKTGAAAAGLAVSLGFTSTLFLAARTISQIQDEIDAMGSVPLLLQVFTFLAITGFAVALPFMVLSPFLTLHKMARREQRLKAVSATLLGKHGSKACISALAEASLERSNIRHVSAQALEARLPDLSEDDYGTCSAQTVANLITLLKQRNAKGHAGFLDEAILNAVGAVAGGVAIAAVEKVEVSSPSERLRQLAVKLLPRLRERQEMERHSSRLLRPVESPTAYMDLLRPAASSETPDELLLRPVEPEEVQVTAQSHA